MINQFTFQDANYLLYSIVLESYFIFIRIYLQLRERPSITQVPCKSDITY